MELNNPMLNTKIYQLQKILRDHKLRTILELTMRDAEDEGRVIRDFRRLRVDGIILVNSWLEPAIARKLLADIPSIQVDPVFAQKTPTIALDRGLAMRLTLEHLIALKHQRIGLIGIEKNDTWKWPALRETALTHGLDPEQTFIIFPRSPHNERTYHYGQVIAEDILRLRRGERPTALIALNDMVAIGLIQVLKDKGVQVPRDISVVGFDHLEIGQQLRPTLTTIDQDPLHLMNRAAQLVMAQIRSTGKRSKIPHETVSPKLVIGESTGPAPEFS